MFLIISSVYDSCDVNDILGTQNTSFHFAFFAHTNTANSNEFLVQII